jgi:glycosyltransferase involved in cell wall biosynthesis
MLRYSVVVCSYNKLKYLKKVAPAIKKHGGSRVELILSDDCSNDGTLEWAKTSGIFNRIVESEKDNGYCLNTIRNKGISKASENHVVLLDADCLPQASYFEGHDSAFGQGGRVISVGFTHRYDANGNNLRSLDHRWRWLRDKEFCGCGWISAYGGNIAFEKSLWSNLNGFDEDYNGAWGLEDADFVYRAEKQFKTKSILHRSTVVRHLEHPPTGSKEDRSGRGKNRQVFKDKHGFYPV